MSSNVNISMSVIKRLPRYYRFLGKLKDEGQTRISSSALSAMMGTTASQIRQDLNCFGGFGQQGYGYNVEQLYNEIGKILGVDKTLDAILIGVGNLGRAIASHMEFEKRGIRLLGIFDKNPALAETKIKQYPIYHTDTLKDFCKKYQPKMAIVCTPTVATEKVIDDLISYGITGFWNYSHFDILSKYPDVNVQNVHLSDSLMTLGYQMKNK
ncbi:MAG: redox-sensing transcriptional repressor Rex [Clostridia bacterium]|nr:redox-sensing transcriptional repressor Rex [Clostridia bacterium]